jgi:hypothetical protein
VRESRIARAFVVLICIALVLWTSAIVPSATHIDFALPVLLFLFLVVVGLSLLRVSPGEVDAQPLAFLTVHTSRPPPLA